MIHKLFLIYLLISSLAFGQDQYFESDGVPIRYRVQGDGPPVVLVHGFMSTLDVWTDSGVFEALSKNYRVVALDCRGHGLSGKPHEPSDYGDQMAGDIRNLLDHLDIQKAHLIGYSMGSRLTGLFLVSWPDRLITATLGASPPRRNWDESQEERAKRFIEIVRQRAATADEEDGQDFEALAAIPASWESQVVSDQLLAANQIPVLAIVGSEDPRVDGMKDVGGILSNMELVIVDGATHDGETGLSRRPEFLEAIQGFLNRNSGNTANH
jgi:pimeloyl-ACP methyl ester carboxylesterase